MKATHHAPQRCETNSSVNRLDNVSKCLQWRDYLFLGARLGTVWQIGNIFELDFLTESTRVIQIRI